MAFQFDIIDATMGEHVFTNGTFTESAISVMDSEDDSAYDFDFISENARNIIVIFSIGFQTQTVTLSVALDGEEVFELFVDAVRKTEDCCNFTEYNANEIRNAQFEQDLAKHVYRILLE
ncbi:Hypothetical protein I595_841 [Croceitalea dokdonensis DOKDO 023]|uniref:Uncharacterized protein n=1 Tax=Croceitalea dokdonensis DOKDO 023 TaxID=1300341 RepID=A0A0P7AG65_9FLAO|nr:hypothetical protein [Croceitalea dokdonensis]KPM32425.1 Hypothetical protein I595_841 [Croceitalea dokdonensis DOKDO 023]